MKTDADKNPQRVWFVLAAPPLIFFILIAAATIYFGVVTQGDADAIAENVPRSMPFILLLLQVILLLVLVFALKKENMRFADIGWRLPTGQNLWLEVLTGSILGAGVGLLYPYAIVPLLESVQRMAGDYVPPGEILPALRSYIVPFFIANILLAPFVEESIYRGYAITQLGRRYRQGLTILITSVFFGLLHWAGGFWYMVLTGGFLGIVLAGLFVWRKNIIVPFMLHLVLNIIEFVFAMQGA